MTEQVPLVSHEWDGETAPTITWSGILQATQTAWHRVGEAASDRRVMFGLMAAILLLAGTLRFTGLAWDENNHLHPDERFLTMVENSLQWPKSFKEYFDTSVNPLNPYNQGDVTYVYGLFPVVVAKFLGKLTGMTGYDQVYLVGRAMSGVMDMLCIVLVFLMGRRLYDARVGLLGALLLCLSVFSIQNSHFFTVDPSTTLFVTLALYSVVRLAQGGGWGTVLMLGVSFGLAVSAKISVLSFPLVIVLAYALRILGPWRRWEADSQGALLDLRGRLGRLSLTLRVASDEGCAPPGSGERIAFQALRAAASFLLVFIVAFLVFRTVQPQAFTGPGFFDLKLNPKWKQDMDWIRKQVSGEGDFPPSHQWTARGPTYMLKNIVFWGLGLPLGVAMWASWALMAYELCKKHKWAHLLPWVWMSFTFFYQNAQLAKYMRYLLPIYPTMALMAGHGLIRLWDWAKVVAGSDPGRWWGRWIRPLTTSLILVVVLGTAFWAFAFTTIYTRPVTRVTASRWIYQNIPRGSTMSFEVWDDPVPLNVDGHNGGAEYKHVKMEPYGEAVPEKREKLYSWLEETEYIALTSNRLYASIPRLYMRFPMTTRYYEALFSGELGYDHLKTFTSRPKLFGIEIVDDDAEESFTVYDHPKVILFKKRPDFSMDRVRALFDGFELERIVRVRPRQVTSAPNNLMLGEDDWLIQRDGGTWSKIFDRGSLSNRLPTLIWLGMVFLVGIIAFPLGFVAFWRMRDRGYVLSKTLGLLLLGYISWLLPSLRLLPYARATIAGVLACLMLASAAVAWTQRRALAAYVSVRWRLLLMNELLFLGFFLLFWLIRRGNPDLWHPGMGGEKPMDLAYLNAIIKSTYFPPYDPWFAGGYINYYYFGWVIVATMIKLTAIVPWVAYNLAIPTLFAMVAMGASCVAFNLIPAKEDEDGWFPRALRYGIVGACLVAVVGNLGEIQLLLNGLQELGKTVQFKSTIPGLVPLVKTATGLWAALLKGQRLPFRPEWWYWNASRIMKHGEINEFPFFTFLYADLHAHLTAMPFALLALALSASLVVTPIARLSRLARDWATCKGPDLSGARPGWWHSLRLRWRRTDWALGLRLTLLGLTVGELWCNNSWDFPTYMGIALVALAFGAYADGRKIDQRTITQFALRAGYVIVLSMLLYRPYHANFGLAYASIEPWKGERTPIGAYLIIHLTPLFILVSYLVTLAFERGTRSALARAVRLFLSAGDRRRRARHLYGLLVRCESVGYELGWLGLTILGLILLALLLAKAWVLLLTLPILVLAGLLTLYRQASPEQRFQTFLVASGVALTIAVDYVVIKGDIGRMNTVFKFYLQVWIMWGVVAAVALARLSSEQRTWPSALGQTWRTISALLLVCVSLYPICASYGKVRDRWIRELPSGLDGMQYMTVARYQDNNRNLFLEHDHRAITWMQDHIEGSPVVAEANTPLYRWGSRVSKYTGLPTIVGWDWHQKQQRASVSSEVVDWRLQDLRDLYNTHEVDVAAEILDRYHVGYVYVGELEQAYYDAKGLAKFDEMVGSALDVAYRQGPVTIYRVRHSGAGEVVSKPATPRGPGWPPWDWIAKQWIPGSVKAEGPEKHPSGDLTEGSKGPTLMLDVPVDRLPVLSDRGWNPLVKDSTILAAVCWWLVVELIGLAAWPLVSRVFGRFHDGGYALSKGIGLLLVSYFVWIGSSLRVVVNSPLAAWLSLAALGSCSFFLWRRRRHDLRDRWRRHRRLILVEEGVFCLAFLGFVGLRIVNPDLWHPWFGGEKMMEIAFLNALTKSAYMPPYDPYFSGGYINYYYYGQFLAAVLIKLTGLTPEVGFNLAVPTFFSLTISHSFGLGYQLCRTGDERRPRPRFDSEKESVFRDPASHKGLPEGIQGALPAGAGGAFGVPQREVSPVRLMSSALWAGVGAATLVAIMGNLSGVVQLVEGLARAGGATFATRLPTWTDISRVFPGLVRLVSGKVPLPPFEYWYRATRIIPHTINEFPFFSFLFADLHPHMIGIPFTLLAASLCLALALDDRWDGLGSALRWAVLAIVMGAVGIINTWDLPTYWGMLGCAMLYRGYKLGGTKGMLVAVATFMVLVLVSLIAYGPFYAHFRAQYVGLGLVSLSERTHLAPFLVIWGFYLFLTVSLVVVWIAESWPWSRMVGIARRFGRRRVLRRLWQLKPIGVLAWVVSLAALAGAGGIMVLGIIKGMLVLALCVPLLMAVGAVLPWGGKDEASFLRRVMVFVALAILVGVEIVYMRDFLEGCEWRRMNTVFKFYIQAWVLLGVAAGSALPKMWHRVRRKGGLSVIWRTALVLLLASSLAYTALAVPVRVDERFPSVWPRRGTLDGTAYMKTGIYAWPDRDHLVELKYDREAIEWLWEHVEGTPVLAEAPLAYYREGGLRICSSTGLPTLLGVHEREQRPWDQVEPRECDAEAVYTTTDLDELFAILERYRVRYIYVGQLEQYAYGGPGVSKFDGLVHGGMLARAFHNDRVDIYRVLQDWDA